MKKTINYYGSFILFLICISILFLIGVNGSWINQNIFLPTMRYINDLVNNLFF